MKLYRCMNEVSVDNNFEKTTEFFATQTTDPVTVSSPNVCRLIGGLRYGSPKRSKESVMPNTTRLLLSLATLASVSCPIAAASIHAVSNTPSVGFKNRSQRRAAGQRNVRSIVSENVQNNFTTTIPTPTHRQQQHQHNDVRNNENNFTTTGSTSPQRRSQQHTDVQSGGSETVQNDLVTTGTREYKNKPAPDSKETQTARSYDPLSYVPGSLVKPTYSTGDSVWIFELGD